MYKYIVNLDVLVLPGGEREIEKTLEYTRTVFIRIIILHVYFIIFYLHEYIIFRLNIIV